MQVIGLDVRRSFAGVASLVDGAIRVRIDVARDTVSAFGRRLRADDEVVLEATGNTATIVRLLRPFAPTVAIANPLQVRERAHAKIKTDRIDAAVLHANLIPLSGRVVWCCGARLARRAAAGRG